MRAGAAIVLAFFAAVWWVLGIRASGDGSALMYAVPLSISTFVIVVALRQRVRAVVTREERSRRARLVGVASGIEGLLLFLATNVLLNIGRSVLIAPVAAIIVGLHFLPLAHWLPARMHYCTSALLIGLGIAGCMIPDTRQRLLTVCLGAACILWLISIVALQFARAQR